MHSVARLLSLVALCIQAGASPTPASSAAAAAVSVKLNGLTYINKGLVAFGLIPSDFRESIGDTLGGIGSGIAFKFGTWLKSASGTYSGTLIAQPDRGFNVDGTTDYQSRRHEIDFVLTPYTGSAALSFADAQKTLALTYKSTILGFERNNTKTSGLDPLAIRPAQSGFPGVPAADPELPLAATSEPHLAVDAEGIVANSDGTFWVSDEYGPYIYLVGADGHLIQTIQPPRAILPLTKKGALNFTAQVNPKTGRNANQGFEGLTLDASTQTLYAMLQSATIQDGGDDKSTSRFTRLLAYDVSAPATRRPPLVGEWVVPLPLSDKGNTQACSEIHFVSPGLFLALSRDGDGRSGDDNNSKYRQADLFDISKATDIHGTKFDDPANPIADDGDLDKSIKAANYVSFLSMIDKDQLARFSLHNGKPDDPTLLNAKWESLALAPVDDPAFPNDFFLFTASDNDFISTKGVASGKPFNAGADIDNQFLVFRVTLPSVSPGSVHRTIGAQL
ncbi:hypothetical protein HGRIS_000727 [Hohenbuehelia grisea]|uniref:Phytase-like domain-containing protein n=1 Tax=Hohenbuehelia grisea TaxID=104357 RepID=A0ABR3IPI5_9AGAR